MSSSFPESLTDVENAADLNRQTRLLVSVRSADEALASLQGGADLIDVKEPHNGALGAAAPEVLQDVAALVGTRVRLSAALGELVDLDVDSIIHGLEKFHFAKIGLANCGNDTQWQSKWEHAWQALPIQVNRVAVAYVDWESANAPDPEEVISVGCAIGCRTFLIDTFDKRRGNLFRIAEGKQLESWCDLARTSAMQVVVAGSLDLSSIPRALQLRPDVIAVRRAACEGERLSSIRADRVSALVRQLSSGERLRAPRKHRCINQVFLGLIFLDFTSIESDIGDSHSLATHLSCCGRIHFLDRQLISFGKRSRAVPNSVLDAIRMGIWDFEPEDAKSVEHEATGALPGTNEKLDVLAERVQSGLPLWHPSDRRTYDDADTE